MPNKQYAKIKRLRKEADRLYQEVCLKLNPLSMVSGKKAEVTHHFVPKSLCMALRYDVANGITLTNGEHFQHHTQGDPEIFQGMTANKSPEWFEYIKSKRQEIVSPTIKWYQEQIANLQCQVKPK